MPNLDFFVIDDYCKKPPVVATLFPYNLHKFDNKTLFETSYLVIKSPSHVNLE